MVRCWGNAALYSISPLHIYGSSRIMVAPSHPPSLVYSALNGRVEDARNEEGLDVRRVDVELLRNEFDVDAGVRLYQLYENLRIKWQ